MSRASERRALFLTEYLRDRNARQAAIRAGYSPKSAGHWGIELLKVPEIAQRIEEHDARLQDEAKIERAEVLRWLRDVVERGLQLKPLRDSRGEPLLDIYERPIYKHVDAKSAIRALELMGKHLGMFTEKLEISGALDMEALEEARQRVLAAQAQTPGLEMDADDGVEG